MERRNVVFQSARFLKRQRLEMEPERLGEHKMAKLMPVKGSAYQCGIPGAGDESATDYHMPPPLVHPETEKIEWSNDQELIIFDLETTCGGRDAEICQIAAVGTKAYDRMWSTYIVPYSEFDQFASHLTGLSVSVLEGERCLMKDGVRVDAVSPEEGMSSFLSYLDTLVTSGKKVVLVAHNGVAFDAPILLRNFSKYGITADDLVMHGLAGFADSLKLLRDRKKRQHPSLKKDGALIESLSLRSVHHFFFGTEFAAHNAEGDTKALLRVLFESSLDVTVEQILEHSLTTMSASAADSFHAKRTLLLHTMKGKLYHSSRHKRSPITQEMATKIAESGLTYSDLESIFSRSGRDGIAALFCSPLPHAGNRPRVTRSQHVIDAIADHFQSRTMNTPTIWAPSSHH